MILLLSLLACSDVLPPGSVLLRVDNTADEAHRYVVQRDGTYNCATSVYTQCFQIDLTERRLVWNKDLTEGKPVDESITFSGVDGQAVNVDVGVATQIVGTDAQIVALARKYTAAGMHDFDALVNTRVRDATRDALNRCASTMSVEQIYGEKRGEIFDCALKSLQDQYEPEGIHVEKLTLNSPIRLPASIQTSMESRISASADADTTRRKVDTITAEGEQKIAAAKAEAEAVTIAAAAQADADRTRAAAITPETLRLRELDIQAAAIAKWDGKLPASTNGSGMFIPLPASTPSTK